MEEAFAAASSKSKLKRGGRRHQTLAYGVSPSDLERARAGGNSNSWRSDGFVSGMVNVGPPVTPMGSVQGMGNSRAVLGAMGQGTMAMGAADVADWRVANQVGLKNFLRKSASTNNKRKKTVVRKHSYVLKWFALKKICGVSIRILTTLVKISSYL